METAFYVTPKQIDAVNLTPRPVDNSKVFGKDDSFDPDWVVWIKTITRFMCIHVSENPLSTWQIAVIAVVVCLLVVAVVILLIFWRWRRKVNKGVRNAHDETNGSLREPLFQNNMGRPEIIITEPTLIDSCSVSCHGSSLEVREACFVCCQQSARTPSFFFRFSRESGGWFRIDTSRNVHTSRAFPHRYFSIKN